MPRRHQHSTQCLLAGLVALGLSSQAASADVAKIQTAPAVPLMDERITLRVSGLRSNSRFIVSASARAQDGLWWRSEASFNSDASGAIDLTSQAALSGSYAGIDGMGLFWSMKPDQEPANASHTAFTLPEFPEPIATALSVRDGNQLLTTLNLTRRFERHVRETVGGDRIVGRLYTPDDRSAHPGVVVIGGSDGGYGDPDVAMLLASHGFSALSLAYFGTAGLPPTLERIPMETFARAINWMRHQPSVDPRFLALYGVSRGTEPALWTAAMNPGVNAVVVRSPSFALWGGITANHLPGDAAWTLRGNRLPYIPNHVPISLGVRFLWDRVTGTPFSQTPLFLENLADFGDTRRVEIPVERIRGPVMLLAGKDDQIWPSYLMATRIMAKLRSAKHPYNDVLLAYENVGHPISYSYLPTAGDRTHAAFAVGGTPEGMAKAQADAWPRILEFLKRAAAGSIGGR